MSRKIIVRTAAVLGLVFAMPAFAQKRPTADGSFMSKSHESMETMNKNMMAVPMTGDADRDFVTMMIPHHQGAIDMAKAYLPASKDPKIKKMAQDVIKAQQKEIAEMREWLRLHPTSPAH